MSLNTRQDVVTDFQGLQSLRGMASQSSPETLEKVAVQFEGIFLQMMLKSMREAKLGDGIMDNDQSQMYQELYDQQIALNLANKHQGGIADALIRQLKAVNGVPKESNSPATGSLEKYRPVIKAAESGTVPSSASQRIEEFSSPQDFVNKLWPLAERYASSIGLDPKVMLAQAALETGWGRAVISDASGGSSHNLFNIKADERWTDKRAVISSLEFEDGVAVQKRAAFRAYPDFESSFADYVGFLRASPRYQDALAQTHDGASFVRALHQAGYATDPEYSNKINMIMNSVWPPEGVAKLKNAAEVPLS
ncbi:MAG: flagellar assembly peptidoglycan hydrolase FlgJ [Gammaproteobacteria bacterium]|nr:flagellar assembly peptidoglycan hydrolase FlgJ [Gammaproteobacteria bacterium]